MKKKYGLIVALIATFLMSCSTLASDLQNVQIFTSKNIDGKITPKQISSAFESVGLKSSGNNDMNKPFALRFKNKLHYKTYNLAMFKNNELTLKLIKKYPTFGLLTPMTMSIWSDKNSMNIATLTINGIARATGIPTTDKDLNSYVNMVKSALIKAMPNGKFKKLNYTIKEPKNSFAQIFVADTEIDEDTDLEEYREDFESELEGELEPIGFLFPNYVNLKEELFDDAGYKEYDFYVTYSICKFDVIYPVSKLHPEAGAYAPCSFFLYKKANEDKLYMGYLGVKNWITTLDIEDKESMKPLFKAQEMINSVLSELTE